MTPERSHHIVIYSVLAFTVAVTFSGFVGAVFQCTPVSSYWDLVNPLENPKCINILAFDTFNLAMSVLEDIIIWALPLPVVWNLKVPRDRKMGLYGLIAISFIAVICAIVRLSMLFIWLRSADIAWNYLLIPFLSNMEACVALITSSIPAIWPLFRRPEQPKVRWGQPPLPTKVEPIKAWDSRDSQDWTTWRSTGDRSSKRWSFWSGTRRGDAGSSRHLSTVQSEGMRTDVKELFDHGDDILPGLAK
ncbi:hypothetical protein MMC21_008023 [Puttea exsequens]|nr:hypothetical protein [Puttea exsequens]